jgi:hypothetical protein
MQYPQTNWYLRESKSFFPSTYDLFPKGNDFIRMIRQDGTTFEKIQAERYTHLNVVLN